MTPPYEQRIAPAVTKAQEVFWAAIASEFPEVRTGDMTPRAATRIEEQMTEAVRNWLAGNWPEQLVARATLSAEEAGAEVTLTRTAEGLRLDLKPIGCDLDGELPGEYWLQPHN